MSSQYEDFNQERLEDSGYIPKTEQDEQDDFLKLYMKKKISFSSL
jgi:hypothetical protein